MALPIIQDQPNFEYYDKYLNSELENTLSDSASAAFEMGADQTIGGAISDINEMRDLKTRSSRMVTPQELNEKYRDTGILFRENTPDLVAEEIVRRSRERNALNERISTGPNGIMSNMVTMGSSIGGNLWGSVTNPVDLAINVALIPFTVGRLGASALQGGRLAMLARPGISGVLARGAAEGVVSGAISTPLMAYRDAQEQRDWDAMDAMSNFGAEVFTSAAFAGGVHSLGVASRKAFKYMRNSDNAIPLAGAAAVEQLSAGKRPNVSPIESLFDRHTRGGIADVADYSGKFTGRSTEIGDLSSPVSGKFYFASRNTYDDAASQYVLGLNQQSLYDADFGEGVYLTNNAGKANNAVATGFNDGGRVFDAELADAKLFEADKALSSKERDPLDQLLKKHGLQFGKNETPSLRDAFERLDDLSKEKAREAKAEINEYVKSLGYDGYATRNLNGEDADGIMLFQSDKVKLGDEAYEPSQKLLKNDIDADLQDYKGYIESESSDLFHNKVDLDSYRAAQKAKDVPEIDREIMDAKESLLEEMRSLEDEGFLSAEDLEAIEAIKKTASMQSSGESVIKAAMACVGKA